MGLSTKLPWTQANPLWAAQLNPVLSNLLVEGRLLSNIALTATTPLTINHMLGKNQTGFIITDQNASASIYRTQPFNPTSLTIESTQTVTISLWVF